MKKKIIIIGAGPAGLTTAYQLLKESNEYTPIILEAESKVGGLAKTYFDENGNGADIGPHRFHSKNDEVLNLWNEILPFQGSPAKDDILVNRKINFDKNGSDPEKTDKSFFKKKKVFSYLLQKTFFGLPDKIKTRNYFCNGYSNNYCCRF